MMIKEVSRCPYCAAVLAIDDDDAAILYEPDRVAQTPCPHLAFSHIALYVYDTMGREQFVSIVFLRGQNWRRTTDSDLDDYLVALVCDQLPEELRPSKEHRVSGGTAGQREKVGDDSEMDAWGTYAPDPDGFVQEISALAKP